MWCRVVVESALTGGFEGVWVFEACNVCIFIDACTTLGFSKATLRRSMH